MMQHPGQVEECEVDLFSDDDDQNEQQSVSIAALKKKLMQAVSVSIAALKKILMQAVSWFFLHKSLTKFA